MNSAPFFRKGLRTALAGAAAMAALGAFAAHASPGSGKSGSGKVDDKIESKIEDKVESRAEDRIDNKTGDKVDDKVETRTGEKVEQKVDTKVEDRAGDKVEEKVSGGVSGKIEDRADKSGSGQVEEAASDKATERAAERQTKAAFDGARRSLDAAHKAELDAAKAAFEQARASGADEAEAKAAYDAAKDASNAAYDTASDAARATYEAASADEPDEDSGNSGSGSSGRSGSGGGNGSSGSGSNSGSSSGNSGSGSGDSSDCREDGEECSASTAAAPRFEGELDEAGALRAKGEILLLADPNEAAALKAAGYDAVAVDELPVLGAVLLRVRARDGLRLADAETLMRRAAPKASIDYNHVYGPSASASAPRRGSDAFAKGKSPAALMRVAASSGVRIGVVDSGVDLRHEALASANVVTADFVSYGDPRPSDHGTSVVSILAGKAARFEGVAAGAKVFEASVFFQPSAGGVSATAASIVRALDWLASQDVSVVNLSLAGPANQILESAIGRIQKRGVVVVAAVGNEGPRAAPLYPAAYDGVVGVTAVGADRRVFRLAGRGPQVDFAAPGVDILHAGAGGGYRISSGTSMAAPFVSAAIAAAAAEEARRDAIAALQRNAEDLGTAGRDPVFGWGLIQPLQSQP